MSRMWAMGARGGGLVPVHHVLREAQKQHIWRAHGKTSSSNVPWRRVSDGGIVALEVQSCGWGGGVTGGAGGRRARGTSTLRNQVHTGWAALRHQTGASNGWGAIVGRRQLHALLAPPFAAVRNGASARANASFVGEGRRAVRAPVVRAGAF